MSHASGFIRFKDNDIWCYEHNWTSDIAISRIYPTLQEVSDNWRKTEWLSCSCGQKEEVEICSLDTYYKALACRQCRSLNQIGPEDPDDLWILPESFEPEDKWGKRVTFEEPTDKPKLIDEG